MALCAALGLGGLGQACTGTSETVSSPSHGDPIRLESGTVPDPVASIVTRWNSDPFARGSYSFLSLTAEPEDRSILGSPATDRLFFAGEATSRSFPATVHGALMSGRRAAREMLDASNQQRPATAIVVGAGAAGLAAAHTLASEAVSVTVLEARDRIGGRIWTDTRLGVPLDLGASWIHGDNGNPLTEMADEIGAPRHRTDYENHLVRDQTGAVLEWSDLPQDYYDVTMIEHEYGADVIELSDYATEEGAEFGGGDMLLLNGYRPLLEELHNGYAIELGAIADVVDTTGADVRVAVGSADYHAEQALITVPLGLLKARTIAFSPPLEAQRLSAIDRLGMGLLNKVVLQFERIFWETDYDLFGYLGSERGRFAEWLNIAKHTGEPILVGFNAATEAADIEAMSDAEIVAEAMEVLRDMYEVVP